MKKMIIVGLCLVTAAIVYGFVDYLKTDKKQLQQMYGDEPAAGATPAAPVAPPAPPVPTAAAKADAAKASENIFTKRRHKKLNLKSYSRAEVEEVYIVPKIAEPAATPVKKAAAPPALAVPVIPVVAAPVVEPAKKTFVRRQKKDEDNVFEKINASSFSRAPMRKKKPVAVDTVSSVTGLLPQQN